APAEPGARCQIGIRSRKSGEPASARPEIPQGYEGFGEWSRRSGVARGLLPVTASAPTMLDLFFRKYAWAANLVLLFAAAWLTAKTVNTLLGAAIRPRPAADLSAPVAAPRPVAPVALDSDALYRLIGQTPPAEVEDEEELATRRPQTCDDPSAEPIRTDLRLQLVATVLSDRPQWSLATIADLSSRETRVVGVGDEIGGARVLGVQRIRESGDATGNAFKTVAVICNGGTKEYVEMGEGVAPAGTPPAPNLGVAAVPRGGPAKPPIEGVRKLDDNRYEIDRSVIDGALGDMSRLATQARLVPSFKNGVANGFKLFAIQPGSLYSAIGLQNGDVIQRINGFEINSPEKALELYQRLKESSHVKIDYERGGKTVSNEYTIGAASR
ncbi:MAG TPA: type II secretion system protein GspC, partial [Anaeromyxobacteraceae bacterium]|nr:type II secretion system protein GspC [Anaeromyxobacteraceae bacterium]